MHLLVLPGLLLPVLLLLAQPDIEVNARDEMGRTALHFAVAFSNKAILRMLLGFPGLDPNVTNNNGRTAIMEAIVDFNRDQGNNKMRIDIMQQMANAPGVDLDAKDLCGRSLEEQVQALQDQVHAELQGMPSLDAWMLVLLPAVLSAARQHILDNDFVFFVAVDIWDFSNIYHLKSAIPCNQPAQVCKEAARRGFKGAAGRPLRPRLESCQAARLPACHEKGVVDYPHSLFLFVI